MSLSLSLSLSFFLSFFPPPSCLSNVSSGLSDGFEGTSDGRHEGRSMIKRHQQNSVRSHSCHEKTAKAKLIVLNVRVTWSDFQLNVCLSSSMWSALSLAHTQVTHRPHMATFYLLKPKFQSFSTYPGFPEILVGGF